MLVLTVIPMMEIFSIHHWWWGGKVLLYTGGVESVISGYPGTYYFLQSETNKS